MMHKKNESQARLILAAALLTLASLTASTLATEVSIPDPDLDAVIREAVNKPSGPLTDDDLLSLTNLDACCRSIRSIEGLNAARNLKELNLLGNQLTSFSFPENLAKLEYLNLSGNPFTNLFFPYGLTNLSSLVIESCGLTNLTLPGGLTGLISLELGTNQLTNLTLPPDLGNLNLIDVDQNQLTGLTLPPGLTNLNVLALQRNQVTNLTLPPDSAQLTSVLLGGNPLASLVLSEPAATNLLADLVASLRSGGIPVYTYPLAVRLVAPQIRTPETFEFAIAGPPGDYAVLGTSNLVDWSVLGTVTHEIGSVVFTSAKSNSSPHQFHRAQRQSPPANMAFIPPGTFLMGSPAGELHRNTNEGPQTTVTLTRGFWIGKYEVTQGEYMSVMETNPSVFPGDLTRPVSSVSWPDATNYCAKLTQREVTAGRIPIGSLYRLPTEAEWECAARAGTTTRFSYGDDPDYASLTNHAWYSLNSELTVHRVGQKFPNPWGLYDMEGNVWEWCQDWLGDLSGGAVVDPQGPPSNSIGWKVIRGGGYDFGEADCRSARRYFFPAHEALNDSNLGFRVVLVTGPH